MSPFITLKTKLKRVIKQQQTLIIIIVLLFTFLVMVHTKHCKEYIIEEIMWLVLNSFPEVLRTMGCDSIFHWRVMTSIIIQSIYTAVLLVRKDGNKAEESISQLCWSLAANLSPYGLFAHIYSINHNKQWNFCHWRWVFSFLDLHMTEGLSLLSSIPNPVMGMRMSLVNRLQIFHVEH